jgi:glycerophosphoryl diester phosphodiesterase
MPQNFPYPAIIAHRGASAYAPENTLAAFRLAVEQRADGIELDVHLSADGEVVVTHDANLGRTTNGTGSVYVKSLTELKQLDAGSWFGAQFVGERLPTLSEVFELVGDQLFVNVELKGPGLFRSALPAQTVEIVRQYRFDHRVIFSSFNPWLLRQTARLMPEAKLSLLLPPGSIASWVRLLSKPVVTPWAYHPHYLTITRSFCERASQEDRPVLAYTVNHPEEISRLCALGIYGIITDDPAKALALRGKVSNDVS